MIKVCFQVTDGSGKSGSLNKIGIYPTVLSGLFYPRCGKVASAQVPMVDVSQAIGLFYELGLWLSARLGQECAYHLAEVFQISGCQSFMDWHKERLLAVENARFNTLLLDERF